MIHGLKALFGDVKWAVSAEHGKRSKRFSEASYTQRTRLRQVRQDVIKFVPFSLFLLIPGGELFLPAWVLVFPNSIPTQFVAEEERAKRFEEMRKKQIVSCERLFRGTPMYLSSLLEAHDVSEKSKNEIKDLK